MRPRTSRRAVLGVACAVVTLVACRDDSDGGSTEAFCAAVDEHQATLFRPPEPSREAIENLLDVYREVGADAPLAVEDEWTAMVELLETSLEEPDEQAVLAESYGSERDAIAVTSWVQENCGVNIPLATVPPPVAPTGNDSTPAAAEG